MNGDVNTETGVSLNKQLAQALGWRVEKMRSGYYALVLPNSVSYPSYLSEREAWQHAPDFKYSVDASLAALPENFHVHIEPYHDGYLTGIINPAAETSTLWQGEGATRAEALARATLAWAQRQEG